MSLTLLAIVGLNCDLKTSDLNSHAKDLALPIKFTHEADLRIHSGFLPVELNEEKSGVEIYFDESLEGYKLPESNELKKIEKAGVITFRWGSDFKEGATALYMASILGAKCQAAVFDAESGHFMTAYNVKAYARLMMGTD